MEFSRDNCYLRLVLHFLCNVQHFGPKPTKAQAFKIISNCVKRTNLYSLVYVFTIPPPELFLWAHEGVKWIVLAFSTDTVISKCWRKVVKSFSMSHGNGSQRYPCPNDVQSLLLLCAEGRTEDFKKWMSHTRGFCMWCVSLSALMWRH